jgi:bis(5'-nucleosidyl)-tetraphosphatase
MKTKMSQTYNCDKGCCIIKIKEYIDIDRKSHRGGYNKAGIFIYDPKQDRVLLVQSRGQLWGPPKGSLEYEKNETHSECAIREVKEETGIDIQVCEFTRAIKIKNRALYYYVEKDTCNVDIQNHHDEEMNDANGITWIKIDCLRQCIKDGHIVLNQHCKIAFKRFMNIEFPKEEFTKVDYKRKR